MHSIQPENYQICVTCYFTYISYVFRHVKTVPFIKKKKINLSLCLIKHYAMKSCREVKVWLHQYQPRHYSASSTDRFTSVEIALLAIQYVAEGAV
jgi:hypothetical protein